MEMSMVIIMNAFTALISFVLAVIYFKSNKMLAAIWSVNCIVWFIITVMRIYGVY